MSKSNLKLPTAKQKKVKVRPVKVTNPLDVRLTFLQLTHHTCPGGFEYVYHDMLTELGFYQDQHGNYWQHIGPPEAHRIIFAAHLDTVGTTVRRVNHKFSKDKRLVYSDGKTILGADDKAGVAILLHMVAMQKPGTYALFRQEESGCVGSKLAADTLPAGAYDAVISFDRAGYSDIITHQTGTRTASDAFADELADRLNGVYPGGFKYEKCDGGVYTDSNSFKRVVPECTNISVGYYGQHGYKESQDLLWLEALASACTLINWQTLPIERDPTKIESKYSYAPWTGSRYWDDDDGFHDPVSRNLDRVLSGNGSTVAYMEARYGMTVSEWSMEDVIELGDDFTEEQWQEWILANTDKVANFLALIAYDAPRKTLETARYVDQIKGGLK